MSEDWELERIKRRLLRRLISEKRRAQEEPSGAVDLDPEGFRRFISTERLALIDFWAEWCVPCRIVHPIVEAVARKYAGRVLVGRLNVDRYPDLAAMYGVMGIPTLMFFHRGSPVHRIVGAVDRQYLETVIERLCERLCPPAIAR